MTISFILFFIFGALIGSFLNVVILRLPKSQSLGGRSHCMNCGRVLSSVELIPVVSFLALRGRCRHCHTAISKRYAIIETITGLLFGLVAIKFFAVTPLALVTTIKWLILSAAAVVIFTIDLEHYLILDSVLTIFGSLLVIVNVGLDFLAGVKPWSPQSLFITSLITAVGCSLPFFLLWYFSSGKWMGFGDVKLGLFLGLALGWPSAVVAIFLGVFLGAIVGMLLLITKVKTLKSRLPFGTFLSFGAVLAIFYGPTVFNWYLSLLGLR